MKQLTYLLVLLITFPIAFVISIIFASFSLCVACKRSAT